MIRSGIFGGCYFNPSGGKKGIKYPKVRRAHRRGGGGRAAGN